jgi:hypothetical protein
MGQYDNKSNLKVAEKFKRFNHRYAPQSKLWKQIPQQAAGIIRPARLSALCF